MPADTPSADGADLVNPKPSSKKRTIAVARGGNKLAEEAEGETKRQKASEEDGAQEVAITNDSIQALADELGIAEEEETKPAAAKKNLSNNAAAKGPASRHEPSRRVDAAAAARTDGVKGRGANVFARVTTEVPRVEPPEQDGTLTLRVQGLKRPFTEKQLRDLLAETGHVVWFWINRIKSMCFVEFQSEGEADATRNALYDLQWPPRTGGKLVLDFVTKQSAEEEIESMPAQQSIGARLGPTAGEAHASA